MRRVARALSNSLLVLSLAAPLAFAASADGVIDTSHVSHVAWQDRRPLCPVDGQSFTVSLRALRNDLTGVRVHVYDGAWSWIDAQRAGTFGPYDVWQATVPATASSQLRYDFRVQDGAALAWVDAPGGNAGSGGDSSGFFVVDYTTLSHAPYGATLLPSGGAVFKVWAPHAPSAWVRGEFNSWGQTAMTRVGEDFVARVPVAFANQQYKYFFGPNGWWAPDARGRVLDPANNYWNSRLSDPTSFTWTDSAWQRPALSQMVIYQLNVGTFCGRNDPHGATPFPSRFVDVAARAHELAALGVNAVMLNPVTSTPSETYAGYSTLTPWSPQFEYGSPDDFRTLVNAFHHEGIAVLCDIVWNHVDPYVNVLWNYDDTPEYFENPATQTPWGPQPAFGRAGVDDYFAASALHWLEEYHVDGFRMDAVAYMNIDPHAPQGWALMQRFNTEVERRAAGAVRIAEEFPIVGGVVQPVAVDGAGFDAQYNGDYESYLRYALPQASGFWYYGYFPPLLASPWPGLTNARQSFNYFELHDNAWDSNGHHRFVRDLAPTPGVVGDSARARLAVAVGTLLTTPGVPALLMGDEWADTTSWGTTAANRIDWAARTANAGYYALVRDLVALRTRLPALAADAPCIPTHANYGDGVFGWMRTDADGRIYLVIANLGDSSFPSYLIGAPTGGGWVERFNSQRLGYGGTGLTNPGVLAAAAHAQDGYSHRLDVKLPRTCVVMFEALNAAEVEYAPTAPGIARVWPNPARGAAQVEFGLAAPGEVALEVLDLQGRRVATLLRGTRPAGTARASWDGRGDDGRRAAPGLYLLRLRTPAGEATKRLAWLR